MTKIHGQVQRKFEKVKEQFTLNFTNKEEIGAAITVFHKGKKVVDLWGGLLSKGGSPWEEQSVVPVFSVTKGIVSFCLAMLAQKKLLDYNKKISDYWPGFAVHAKGQIRVKDLLEHRAGLHGLDKKLHINDFIHDRAKVYSALVNQKPAWPIGKKQGYAAQSWGAYVAELFRRIAGITAGEFYEKEVRRKLKLNLYIGLPHDYSREVATLYPVPVWKRLKMVIPHIIKGDTTEGKAGRASLKPNSSIRKAFLNPSLGKEGINTFNRREIQETQLLWANAIGDARSLATLFNIMACNGKNKGKVWFSSPLMKQFIAENPLRYDEVICKNMGWNLGFLKEEKNLFSPNHEAFGHSGMGGSLAFADPKAGISLGYVCNQMDHHVRAPKTLALCKAVYACL